MPGHLRAAAGGGADAGDAVRGVPGVRHRGGGGGAPRAELPGPGDDGVRGRARRGAPRRVPPPRRRRGAQVQGVGLAGAGVPVRRRAARRRWSEMELGRVAADEVAGAGGDDVVASFEVLGWYPKRGLVVECMEFRPVV